ncbi:MAG TPA: 1-(5-phosphoribosyl)-5-[(5-phosphoribosylamino)methylideneamino]imidazole-4-carboxamide isomerase, partial [Gammaproteobacteria bacterium]|nr:1-(5-phosphoribosyl)-5-[(5-phosphoribosylamino)methylideneamino]imidazole-4-carboxamide isomerase [Gammaproteobacteria bacterium]
MLIIPAIDLKDGKCVRLFQGQMDQETVYSGDPVAVAEHWVEAGARRLHVVDLDGARTGAPQNAVIIGRIIQAFPDLTVQVGGGIRNDDTIETYLEAGVSYVIIGTNAVSTPHFVSDACIAFPGHIIVALDAREGKIAIDGWSKMSNHNVIDIAKRFERDGVEAIIYTDISRDGTLTGVNLEATLELAQAVSIPIIASGGVSTLDDIKGLCRISEEGVTGV